MAYAAAHFGKSLFWHFSGLLLAFFLTEVANLSPATMGIVLATSLIASALADMAVGALWRNTLARPQAAASLQLWGSAASACALLALFSTPLMDSEFRPAAAALTAVALRLAYSLFDTPQNALMALAAPDAAARSHIATLRIVVSSMAALTLTIAVMPLIATLAFTQTADHALLFVSLGAAMSAIAVGTALGLRLSLGRRPAPADLRPISPTKRKTGAFSNWPGLAPLLALTFALLFGLTAFAKLEPYFVAYVLRSPLWAGVLTTAGVAGVLFSQLMWRPLLTRLGNERAFPLLSLGLLGASIAFGLTARHPTAATACAALLGAFGGGLSVLLWTDVADRAATGPRSSVGLTFGLFTATAKAAPAASGLLVGLWLMRIDYRAQDSDALIGAMVAFPVAGAIGCLLIACMFRKARTGPATA